MERISDRDILEGDRCAVVPSLGREGRAEEIQYIAREDGDTWFSEVLEGDQFYLVDRPLPDLPKTWGLTISSCAQTPEVAVLTTSPDGTLKWLTGHGWEDYTWGVTQYRWFGWKVVTSEGDVA